GSASDAGSGVQKVEVSIKRNSDNLYWNVSSFSSASEVFNLASGIGPWSYAFALPADGSYTARSRATDNVSLVETPGIGNTFTVDTVGPIIASIIVPANGSAYTAATVPATFSGSVQDNSGGVGLDANSTTFTLKRLSDNFYWTGATWQSAANNLATLQAATSDGVTAPWTNSAALPTWANQA